jgi:ABC-type transport system involved in multi-copper enzyme maturation permease subunit
MDIADGTFWHALALRRRQCAAVARTTLTEALQQPAALLLTLSGVAATALIPVFQLHSFGEAGRLARDGGLAYQLTLGLVLAAGAASGALHGEIIAGTAAAAISKPVSRHLFLLGKFRGVALLVTRFWFCLLATTLLAERVAERYNSAHALTTDNRALIAMLATLLLAPLIGAALHHQHRARFGVAAFRSLAGLLTACLAAALVIDREGRWAPAAANLDWRIVPAALLVLAVLLVFTAIATALAARFKPGTTLIVCLLLLALGLVSDTLLAPSQPLLVRLPALLAPNVQSFWMADALAHGGAIPLSYLARAAAYAAACCAAALGCGMLLLRERDIG